MDLETDVRSQQILNLRNYGDNDIDFFQQSEKLMKNGFLDTRGEEYGYYQVNYRTRTVEGSLMYIHTLAVTVPLIFLGFPTENAYFYLTADLYIFDSAGNLVKQYQKTGEFSQAAGIYYGGDTTVTQKASRIYSRLYTELFQMANMQSGEINQALMAAGPITKENNSQALANIASNFSRSSTSSSSGGSASSGSSSGASQQQTQKTYVVQITYEMSGTNVRMTLPYPIKANSAQEAQILAEGRWRSTNFNNNKFLYSAVTSSY
ncbi:MAG: hypothetical protein LBF78_05900 [Treponema sp.]|jgi:hypothetical protein|nr:hypothetical protein [Treponema sp.]